MGQGKAIKLWGGTGRLYGEEESGSSSRKGLIHLEWSLPNSKPLLGQCRLTAAVELV